MIEYGFPFDKVISSGRIDAGLPPLGEYPTNEALDKFEKRGHAVLSHTSAAETRPTAESDADELLAPAPDAHRDEQ